MLRIIKPEKLGEYLGRIARTFPELRANRPLSKDDISQYYEQSSLGYSLFHSSAGAIHMAISSDGTFNKNDYLVQAEHIVRMCQDMGESGAVLEAGCGKGFNLNFIARRLPRWKCSGVDFTAAHIEWAQRRFGGLSNLQFEQADFHDLDQVVKEKQEIVFFVESICHAADIGNVLRAVDAILHPGGRIVIFDGFRIESAPDQQWHEAAELVEAAMAVPRFPGLEEFKSIATSIGFKIDAEEDFSTAIMPNLLKLSDTAKAFFKIRPVSRLLMRFLPRQLVANSVAGLLMPLTVSKRIHGYYKFTLSKQPKRGDVPATTCSNMTR